MPNPINLPWQTIDTVFLDMDGTLLDLHYDNHFWLEYLPQKYAELKQIPLSEANDYLVETIRKTEGTLNWYSLDYWQEQLQIDIITLKHEVGHKVAIRDSTLPFLAWLKEQDKRIVLLTNAHQKTMDVKFEYVEIAHCFDRIITSHDLNLAKEQTGFWQKLTEIENFDKHKSLFIDDNLDVLDNAQRYGVKHLLAIHKPDSRKAPKPTKDYVAVECYSQLMGV